MIRARAARPASTTRTSMTLCLHSRSRTRLCWQPQAAATALLLCVLLAASRTVSAHLPRRHLSTVSPWGLARVPLSANARIPLVPRGGAASEEEYDEETEYDVEDEDEEEQQVAAEADEVSEYDYEDEEEEEDETGGVQIEVNVEKFDEPLVASPLMNLYASLGVMLLGRKVDLFSPTMVRIARFAFIGYIIALQVFVLYVRIHAKKNNDRTPITLKNPLSSVLQSQLGSDEGGMMKNLASSFLSSKSTVMEYDLKQAKSMQSGLIINMAFMWFLHFKMEQVQPLLIQAATGIINMVYSPLFQVYVLKRNLERPFVNPAAKKVEEAQAKAQEESEAAEAVDLDESEEEVVEEIAAEEAEKVSEAKDDEEDEEAGEGADEDEVDDAAGDVEVEADDDE